MGAAASRTSGGPSGERTAAARHLVGLPQSPRLAWAEALSFPASWILDLPRAVQIALHVPGVAGVVRLTRSQPALVAAGEVGEVAFDAPEWRALVLAVEADRAWPADLREWCARKRDEAGWRLTDEIALAGAQPDPDEQWSLADVLRRLGAEVIAIDLE